MRWIREGEGMFLHSGYAARAVGAKYASTTGAAGVRAPLRLSGRRRGDERREEVLEGRVEEVRYCRKERAGPQLAVGLLV